MANRATRGISDHHHPAAKETHAQDPGLAVIPAPILNLQRQAREHQSGIFKVQAARGERTGALGRILGEAHDGKYHICIYDNASAPRGAFGAHGWRFSEHKRCRNSTVIRT